MRLPKLTRRNRRAADAFTKTIVRSIRSSLGRFLAIVGIVCLGCGFYAGLKMCGPDMRAAADELYDGTNLYDLRVVSTLGFTKDDVDRLSAISGVESAMAATSVDAMARVGTARMAIRIGSLDVDAAREGREQGANAVVSDDGRYLNRVFLREGRLPSGPDECVMDADNPASEVGIGDQVELLYGTSDLEDMLRERRLTIVGTVSSSNYPYTSGFGSTTLGSGVIAEYVFVSPEAFVDDAVFTEIYLRVAGADALVSGTDAYEELVGATADEIERQTDELARARRDDLTADAREKVARGRAELEEKRAQAQKEMDEGKARLDEAATEIADGEQQLADGVKTYEEQRDSLHGLVDNVRDRIYDRAADAATRRAQLVADEAAADAREQELLTAAEGLECGSANLVSARVRLTAHRAELELSRRSREALDAARVRVSELEARTAGLREELSTLGAPLGSVSPLETERALLEGQLDVAVAALDTVAERTDNPVSGWLARETAEAARRRVEELKARIDDISLRIEQARSLAETYASAANELVRERATELALNASAGTLPEVGDLDAEIAATDAVISGIDGLWANRIRLSLRRQAISLTEGATSAASDAVSAGETLVDERLAEGAATVDDARATLEEGKQEWREGTAELDRARTEAEERFAEAEAELADAERKIEEVELPDIYLLDRTKNEGVATYDADTHRMDSIAQVFPLMFFLVAALVALTTMTRMVDDERIEIGTYKALGYSTARIASKYLVYAGLASATGALLGILTLSQLLPLIVTSSYATVYAVPLHPIPYPIDPLVAAGSLGIGVGVTLLATWAAVVASLREVPARLMLPRPPASGKRILLERLGPLWRHLSFSWKVTFRNLFRYKRRLAMTVVGIAGCTALLLVGFGLHDAIWDIIARHYGPIVHYDTAVSLDDEATSLDIHDVERYLSSEAQATNLVRVEQKNMLASSTKDEETIFVAVVIPRDAHELDDAVTLRERVSGEGIDFTDDSVVVTEKLAMKYGLAVGDEIVLHEQDSVGNAYGDAVSFKIDGIAECYVGNSVYIGRNAWHEYDDERLPFSRILCSLAGDKEAEERVEADLGDRDHIATIAFSTESIEVYTNMLSVVDLVVCVLIVSAGLLAFIVLYNLTNINIGERVREIASLKVLGFTRGEVYAYIFREVMLLSIIGDAFGMLLGTALATFVITTAEVDYVMFGRTIHPMSYVWSFVLTLVFTVIVLALMRHKLDRVDMVESLKSVD